MNINDQTIKSLRPARSINLHLKTINAIDFSPTGEKLLSSSLDESIMIYDAVNGLHKRSLKCEKYGVSNLKFTNDSSYVIHSSTKINRNFRLLNNY